MPGSSSFTSQLCSNFTYPTLITINSQKEQHVILRVFGESLLGLNRLGVKTFPFD